MQSVYQFVSKQWCQVEGHLTMLTELKEQKVESGCFLGGISDLDMYTYKWNNRILSDILKIFQK